MLLEITVFEISQNMIRTSLKATHTHLSEPKNFGLAYDDPPRGQRFSMHVLAMTSLGIAVGVDQPWTVQVASLVP